MLGKLNPSLQSDANTMPLPQLFSLTMNTRGHSNFSCHVCIVRTTGFWLNTTCNFFIHTPYCEPIPVAYAHEACLDWHWNYFCGIFNA